MKAFFEFLEIEETLDIHKIEKACQMCIEKCPEKEWKYIFTKKYILENIDYLKYKSTLKWFRKEIENPNISMMYYRVKKVLKSKEFQEYKNQEKFQKYVAYILDNKCVSERTIQLLVKEFPLKRVKKNNPLYQYLKQYNSKQYAIRITDILIILFGIISIILCFKWHLLSMVKICSILVTFYIGFIVLYTHFKWGTNLRTFMSVFVSMCLVILVAVNNLYEGRKLGNELFQIEVVDKNFFEGSSKPKIIDNEMLIYDDVECEYQVFNNELKKIKQIRMPEEYQEIDDDIVFFYNQYYYTIRIDDTYYVKNIKNKIIYQEKYKEGIFYKSCFFIDDEICYLVICVDNQLKIYQLKVDNCLLVAQHDFDNDINSQDMILKDGMLYYKMIEDKDIYMYNIATDDIQPITHTFGSHIDIRYFQFNHLYTVASTNSGIFISQNQGNKNTFCISNVSVDKFIFYDENRIFFTDDDKVSLYNIKTQEYENSLIIDCVYPYADCVKFEDYVILYDGDTYNALKLKYKK